VSVTEHGIRVSILTPSYNQGEYIEQTIASVAAQEYPELEHIVIDGGSTDGTVALLKKYPYIKWKSERDKGQADALNKGLAMSTGEIIGWINSDDYYNPGIIHEVVIHFLDPAVQWVIGNISYLYECDKMVMEDKSPVVTYRNLLRNPDIVRQQATFFRKTAIESVGGWNERLYMTMDYDLWVRMAKVSTPIMVDRTWAVFRFHPAQKTSFINLRRQTGEITLVLRKEKAPRSALTALLLKKHWYIAKGLLKWLLLKSGLLDRKYEARPLRRSRQKVKK